jgi:hypothetical protein
VICIVTVPRVGGWFDFSALAEAGDSAMTALAMTKDRREMIMNFRFHYSAN